LKAILRRLLCPIAERIRICPQAENLAKTCDHPAMTRIREEMATREDAAVRAEDAKAFSARKYASFARTSFELITSTRILCGVSLQNEERYFRVE